MHVIRAWICQILVEQVSVPQPLAGALVVGAGVRHEPPEMARVIEPPQVHQLWISTYSRTASGISTSRQFKQMCPDGEHDPHRDR